MKNSLKLILIFVAALLIATFIWLFYWRENFKHVSIVTNLTANAQVANSSASKTSLEIQSPPSNRVTTPSAPMQSNHVAQNSIQQRAEMIRRVLEAKNVPLDFYGRIIDQDGNVLSGAKIKVSVRHWGPAPNNDMLRPIPVEREADENGCFKLDGVTGDVFDIDYVQKQGYELDSNTRPGFNVTGGSLNAPIVFKMWSTNIHEPLITGRQRFNIIPDGRSYFINLNSGTIAESGEGDLKVQIRRPDPIIFGQRYDWSCEMDVLNGGLLQEIDTYSSMFSAPPNGYAPTYQYKQEVESGWGDSTGAKRFYVTLKNGQEYGRIVVELYAYYNDHIPGLIDIKYAVNPTGSHILR